jgi:hypothetical protein
VGDVTVDKGPSTPDEIMTVLKECEATLRQLQRDGRLTPDALKAFADLSARLRTEMERRKAERRSRSRGAPDRRSGHAAPAPGTPAPSEEE